MSDNAGADWEPLSSEVLCDQIAAYDSMRERCPVAYSEFLQWSLFRHEDIWRVLHDPETFSSSVSRHVSVPNGMDPPEHTIYRRIIEPYFAPEKMDVFEPACRAIITELLDIALASGRIEVMTGLALPFAVRVQCAFLGWPAAMHEPLARWTKKNQQATHAGDRKAMAEIALEFEGLIDEMLEIRRRNRAAPDADVTASLMHETVNGRPLGREEISSILRNWTVGEVGTIAAAIGILLGYLAGQADVQARQRDQHSLLPAAIDEILRIHGPLVANRRVTMRAVELGGRGIGAGERISLIWPAANRDERAFEDAAAFRPDRDPSGNLLYGAGIHVCPGAPLARMELRVVMEEVLRLATVEYLHGEPPINAGYPASGFSSLPLRFRALRA